MKNNTAILCNQYQEYIDRQVNFFRKWTLEEVCSFFGVNSELHENKEDVICWVNWFK